MRAQRSASVNLVGFHCHIGSNVFVADSFAKAASVMAEFAAPSPSPSSSSAAASAYPTWRGSRPVDRGVGRSRPGRLPRCRHHGDDQRRAGAGLVAGAAVTLYTVGTIKRILGVRTYVAVDGGMSDNPRPVLYGSGYEAMLPRVPRADRRRRARVVGKHCESGDILIFEAHVPPRTSASATCSPCP